MNKAIAFGFNDNFIEKLADHLIGIAGPEKDLSGISCVFSNSRSILFLNKELSKRMKMEFFPPDCYVFDDYVDRILASDGGHSRMPAAEACYLIYKMLLRTDKAALYGKETFASFLPWAKEIYTFIESLDLECIPDEKLKAVERSAAIGYDVPDAITSLLLNISSVRKELHGIMEKERSYSRGYKYFKASQHKSVPEDGKKVLFCNFFYLQEAEKRMIRNLSDKAVLLFQGDQNDWSVLKENSKYFGVDIKPQASACSNYALNVYSAPDKHGESAIASDIISKKKNVDSTVIVMPDQGTLMPLVSCLSSKEKDLNIAMGYDLSRSSVYKLISSIFEAQISSKSGKYYAKDYLEAILHPLAKNIRLTGSGVTTRILCHKVQEVITGMSEGQITGALFLDLRSVERDTAVIKEAIPLVGKEDADEDKLADTVKRVHDILFRKWEGVSNFQQLSAALLELIETITSSSILGSYPIDHAASQRIYELAKMLGTVSFKEEVFGKQELFAIFDDLISGKKINYSGAPLKGLQLLGLYKTHSLNFESVIVLDANESVLPVTRPVEPLVPREVMLGLGLIRPDKEEEIQRYQFKRLICGAKEVHLIYIDDERSERSRYVEELIWEQQKKEKKNWAATSGRGPGGSVEKGSKEFPVVSSFSQISLSKKKEPIEKSKKVSEWLKGFDFSPTAVNTYLNCPASFYFKNVLALKENEDMLDDVEAVDVGNFVHELLDEQFRPFVGNIPVIDADFRKRFLEKFDASFDRTFMKRMPAEGVMLKEVLRVRLKSFLDKEDQRGAGRIVSLEKKYRAQLGGFRLNGRIDRIEQASGVLTVIDYKTGGTGNLPVKKTDVLEGSKARKELKISVRSFQLPIYLYLAQENGAVDSYASSNAALYSIKEVQLKPLWSKEAPEDIEKLMELYLSGLTCLLEEITDPAKPFEFDDEDRNVCRFCPYSYLCR